MSRFGWAYVNCDETSSGANAEGVTGSVMFLTGSGNISGSNYFMYNYDGSVPGAGGTTSSLILTGTFFISGAISASSYHFEDITRIEASGSTRFGNTNDDQHVRTGSLTIGRTNQVTFHVDSENRQISMPYGIKYGYATVSGNTGVITYASSSNRNYIIGVKGQCPVEIRLHSASGSGDVAQTGSLIVIKDEFTGERMPIDGVPASIVLSGTDGETIDGEPYYEMTGTMTALSVYSNGSNWFVF
tara:strand:+ start:539 stop:1270 length:732 start_codon:yes stop_codon:yes gene_type:complete